MSFLAPRWSWSWPSWLTELVSGVVCCLLALAILVPAWWASRGRVVAPPALAVYLLAFGFGVLYELRFDPNGWDVRDVMQRTIGVVVGGLLWHWLA